MEPFRAPSLEAVRARSARDVHIGTWRCEHGLQQFTGTGGGGGVRERPEWTFLVIKRALGSASGNRTAVRAWVVDPPATADDKKAIQGLDQQIGYRLGCGSAYRNRLVRPTRLGHDLDRPRVGSSTVLPTRRYRRPSLAMGHRDPLHDHAIPPGSDRFVDGLDRSVSAFRHVRFDVEYSQGVRAAARSCRLRTGTGGASSRTAPRPRTGSLGQSGASWR